MPLTIWIAAFALAVSIPVAWFAVASTRSSTDKVRTNLAAGLDYFTDMRRVVLEQSAHERVVQPSVSALARRARRITPAGMIDSLERKIALAGAADEWPTDRLLAIKLLTGIVGLIFGAFIALMTPSLMGILLLGLMA